MKNLKNIVFTGWNSARLIRLGLAVLLLVQFFITGDSLLLFFGMFLSVQSLLNVGCCAGNTCAPAIKGEDKKTDVVYEEIK